MQQVVKMLKIIMGQSNTLLVVIKEEESFMCTCDEQTYILYSNVETDSLVHLCTCDVNTFTDMFILINEREIY